jgi:hypothetical protein
MTGVKKSTITATVDPVQYRTFQVLNKRDAFKNSTRIQQLIAEDNCKRLGEDPEPTLNYADLQRQQRKLSSDRKAIHDAMSKEVFDGLVCFLGGCSFNFDTYKDADKVIAELLKMPTGSVAADAEDAVFSKPDIQLCIQLIEVNQKLCEVEVELRKIQAKIYLASETAGSELIELTGEKYPAPEHKPEKQTQPQEKPA